jgi:hypothetical protein
MCDSCGAAVVFAKLVGPGRHRANPIDATPSDDGNIRLYDDGRYAVIPKADLAAYRQASVKLHKSHFATCPNAHAHRKVPA